MDPEPIIAASEMGPSLLGAALRMGLIVVVLTGGAWVWFYWQKKTRAASRHLEVLDRAFLARGACVTLLRVDRRRLLVGVSAEGVRLIRDLEPAGPRGAEPEAAEDARPARREPGGRRDGEGGAQQGGDLEEPHGYRPRTRRSRRGCRSWRFAARSPSGSSSSA